MISNGQITRVIRNITSEEWINSSIEYNNYFINHEKIGKTKFTKLDITNMKVEEIADNVIQWVGTIEV